MRERERESSIADMNDPLVTNEQVAPRRENANVFLLKFAHTRVSLLSSISISIDINMTTTTTRRKQKRSSSSSLHSSSSSSSAPSSSSSPSRRAMMTLLLLLFGTISDVFVVRATWPIVRYKNGTVGVKNDGGTVKVQSTDLIVDGNLSVSGSLFIQDRDLAEYEDRVSFLETALGVNVTMNVPDTPVSNNCTAYRTRKYPKTATTWDYLSLPSAYYSGKPSFPTSVGTDAVLAWNEVNQICVDKGMELCKSVDLCPSNEPAPGLNIWGSQFLSWNDHWIAVGDEENEWYSFHNPTCTKHSIHAGSKPAWGTTTSNPGAMSRAGLCCSGLASQPSSLTHWIDFSTHYMESLYGMGDGTNIATFADLMGNATDIKVNGKVKYTPNVQNGLGAVYMNAEQTGLEFTSSKLGSNPEVVVVYRIVSKTVSGLLLSSRLNGYHFGTYKTKDGYVGCSATNGKLIVEQEASYDEWHVANLYFGDNNAFLIVDGDESKKNTFGIAGRYGTSSLTNVLIGFYPSTDHYVNAYVGEVMYFNSKLSNSDRSMVTSYLMSKWGISSSGNTTCTESSIDKSTSVVSQLQSLTPPTCMPPGGDKLQFDGRSWICGCADGWTGDDCGTFEGIQDFHVSDAWFRSPFLSESSSLPTISTISAYLSNMTTCRRDTHSIDYKDCANPDSDWREARITFQSSFSTNTLLADGCGLTSGEGKNTGVCMSWRCDSSVCGGDDPFYAKGQTMLIASEKFYRLERDFSYALQTWLLGTAQVFIQSKSTREIVKLTNSDMTTYRPAWSSNYVETAYAKFDIQETGDYRVIVSLKADNDEGAMFNLMSIQKSFMGSNDLSKFFFAFGTYSGCQYVCPYVGDEQVCDGVENTGCDYYR